MIGPPIEKPGSTAAVTVPVVRDHLGCVRVRQLQAQRLRVGVRVGHEDRFAAQHVALQVEEGVAAPAVRAALGEHADDAARGAAVLRGVARRLHLDLFDEVSKHVLARDAVLQVRRLRAVHDVAVLAGARPVDHDAAGLGLLFAPARLRDQRREVATLREHVDLLGADAGRTCALLDVDQRRFRRDHDLLGDARHREAEVELLDLAEQHLHVLELAGLEAGQIGRDLVHAGRHRRQPEHAAAVRRRRDDGAGVDVLHLDRDTGQDAALRVLDDPFDAPALLLGDGRPAATTRAHRRTPRVPLRIDILLRE